MKKTRNEKPATIYDIAKLTGLTGATVSRVLNDRGYIAEGTRAKVMAAAKQLNYVPNPAARTLKTRRTNQIMLSVPDIQNEFYFEMISAIQAVARKHDCSLLLTSTESSVKEELNILKKARENLVDGLIFVSMNISENHLKEIAAIQRPIVVSTMSANKIEGGEGLFDFVGIDTRQGIYLAAKYLINQGHKQIGYAGLPLGTQTGEERYAGFCLAMKESGLEINQAFQFTGSYSEAFGYDTGIRIASMSQRPTAVCSGCDAIALGLYRAFEQADLSVPLDISISGMDNTYIASRVTPKMTTVSLSQDRIGKSAAEIIFERLAGTEAPHRTLLYSPELIVRDSVSKL